MGHQLCGIHRAEGLNGQWSAEGGEIVKLTTAFEEAFLHQDASLVVGGSPCGDLNRGGEEGEGRDGEGEEGGGSATHSCCLLIAYSPSNALVYLRDASA